DLAINIGNLGLDLYQFYPPLLPTMVFANLSQKDKDAFFALLDEYFESRPELLAGLQGASSSTHHQQQTSVGSTKSNASGHATNTHSATTTNHHAVNTAPRPPMRNFGTNQSNTSGGANGATSPAPSVTSFSKGRPVPPTSNSGNGLASPPAIPSRTQTPRVVEPPAEETSEREDIDEAPVSVSSRIAAAQAALGGGMGKPPVPNPRRTSATSYTSQGSTAEKAQNSPPPMPARSTPTRGTTTKTNSTPADSNSNGLVSSRGIGSIDTSSAGAAASSVFSFKGVGKNEKPAANFAPSQPTFPRAKTRDTFAPPPSRRETQAAQP
ncbi:6627_t:CDS:2, partial [Acaulospora colombiana]